MRYAIIAGGIVSNVIALNDRTWASTVDGNVWEPGVYGWEEVV